MSMPKRIRVEIAKKVGELDNKVPMQLPGYSIRMIHETLEEPGQLIREQLLKVAAHAIRGLRHLDEGAGVGWK